MAGYDRVTAKQARTIAQAFGSGLVSGESERYVRGTDGTLVAFTVRDLDDRTFFTAAIELSKTDPELVEVVAYALGIGRRDAVGEPSLGFWRQRHQKLARSYGTLVVLPLVWNEEEK